MALTLNDVTAILKDKYLPVMEKHINTEDFLSKWVDKHKQTETVGNSFVKSFKYGHSEGTGMLTDLTGRLSDPGRAMYKTFKGTPKWRDGVIKIYETIVNLMNTDEKAFIDEITSETEGVSDAMKCEKERMNFGDGGITPLAVVSSATDDTPSLITLADGSTTKYLRPGMPVDFMTTEHALITNGSGLIIQDIVSDTEFTFIPTVDSTDRTTLVTALAGALIYHKGGYENEFYGLKALVGLKDNTILGVDRSKTEGAWFRPTVKYVQADGKLGDTSVGANHEPSMVALMGLVNKLTTQQKAKKNNLVIFADGGTATQLVSSKINGNEYIEPTKKIDLWPYNIVTFNGIPILSGNYSPDNTAFFVEMSGLVQFLAKKLGFSDMDGNMWKWVAGYAAYTAYLLEAYELGHYKPWQCATVYDIASAY
jgi:hypothetical protein